MNVTLRIPDELAARLATGGAGLERQALEALVIEGFRSGRLSKDDLGAALGLDGGDQIDGFLKAHDVFEDCTLEDIDIDIATVAQIEMKGA
jgi:hypothetical protein